MGRNSPDEHEDARAASPTGGSVMDAARGLLGGIGGLVVFWRYRCFWLGDSSQLELDPKIGKRRSLGWMP